MRVALVSAWYLYAGGAEWVDHVFGEMFPEVDVFTLFSSEDKIPKSLRGRSIHRSFLHRIPTMNRSYRLFMPLLPYAIESFDLRGYDLIISSDHGAAKGVLSDQDSVHICYCYTPWRQLYDLYWKSNSLVPAVLRPAYRWSAHYLRQWDYLAAQRPDRIVGISKYIQQRIQKHYRRDSEVIYPPVDTARGYISERHDNYYLSAGRLVHAKRTEVLIEACNRLRRRLVIAGDGPEQGRLKSIAGPTVEFVGRVSDDRLRGLYAHCRAFLFAADEDFGIAPVEAQSYGRPVIAYGHGGSLETVRVADPRGRSDTGVLFSHQTVESAMEGIQEFEFREDRFSPSDIRDHAFMFDISVFRKTFLELVERLMQEKKCPKKAVQSPSIAEHAVYGV
jgi:glycosyltransferase involved in cell wall biosynthesis